MTNEIALMTATEMTAAFRAGRLSPVETCRAALAAVERLNPQLNAFRFVDEEGAMSAARASESRWQKGAPLGPVDGVPTSVKDLLITAGWPTLRGSKAIDPAGPWTEDAPSVARLKEGGAVLLGKTTTPEFGWKGVTDSPLTGITRNPWNPERTPGGSSGGAAVAAATGMGALHLGTDGGGSVRIPCAFTGIPGLKPTFSRVPASPLSPFGTLAHVGPMTRSVADCALLLRVIAAPDLRDPYALPDPGAGLEGDLEASLSGVRIAFLPDLGGTGEVAPEVAEIVRKAAGRFTELGAVLETPEIALPDTSDCFRRLWFAGAARVLSRFDAAARSRMDPGLVQVAEAGARFSALEYLEAVGERENFAIAINRLQERYDLLLTPTLPITAFAAGQEAPGGSGQQRWTNWTPFTYPFNLTGQPALSLPCGLDSAGLPVSLQIVGRRFADLEVLRAGRAFERLMPAAVPPLAR